MVFLDGDATPLPFPAFLGEIAGTLAPPPVYVPGRHLTMIASPGQVAAAIDSLGNSR